MKGTNPETQGHRWAKRVKKRLKRQAIEEGQWEALEQRRWDALNAERERDAAAATSSGADDDDDHPGCALRAANRGTEALDAFRKVAASDADFREVQQQIAELENRSR